MFWDWVALLFSVSTTYVFARVAKRPLTLESCTPEKDEPHDDEPSGGSGASERRESCLTLAA